MANQPHLRPVEPPTDGEIPTGRQSQRQRATKALPTDRMKMDRQIAVLGALGRLSGPRKDAVNGDQLSRAVGGIVASTVILSNRFFADAGWVVPSGRGLYAATDELVEYTRRLATGTREYASEVLRAPARRSWFWEILEPYLADGGRLPLNEAAILLMREAGAMDHHMTMIQNLVAWLEYVGLIAVQDNYIVGAGVSDGVGTPSAGLPAEPRRSAEPQRPAGPEPTVGPEAGGEGPIVQDEELPPATLLGFNLDVYLTVDDLARLTPEQIKAFFEAVGALAALKNKG
jgi:hypothetical protein